MDSDGGKAGLSTEPLAVKCGNSGGGGVGGGGVNLGGDKIYSLAYADDVVMLAEEEGEMKSMMERLKGYLESRGLELNEGKTKVMTFREGGERQKSYN